MPHVRALLPGCVVGREPGCVRAGWAAETIRDVCVRHWLREGAIRGPAFAPGASAASLGQRGSVERPLERDGLWTSVVEGHVASCLSSVRFSHETDRVGGLKPRTTHGEAFSLRPVVVVHREEREEEGPHRHCMLVNLFVSQQPAAVDLFGSTFLHATSGAHEQHCANVVSKNEHCRGARH